MSAVLSALADHLETVPAEDTGRAHEWLDARSSSPTFRRRVLDLVARGELPGSRVGRKIVVRRSDLDAYLMKHRVEARPTESAADRHFEAWLAENGIRRATRRR